MVFQFIASLLFTGIGLIIAFLVDTFRYWLPKSEKFVWYKWWYQNRARVLLVSFFGVLTQVGVHFFNETMNNVLAFAGLSLSGDWKNQIWLGIILASVLFLVFKKRALATDSE